MKNKKTVEPFLGQGCQNISFSDFYKSSRSANSLPGRLSASSITNNLHHIPATQDIPPAEKQLTR
jgi:hypothetical protein